MDTTEVSSAKREVATFELSDKLGFNIVPPTFLTTRNLPNESKTISNETGSEQEFVGGCTWGQMCVDKGDEVKNIVKKPKIQKQLGMMAVFDYLSGSADRHNENFMIDGDNLYAIDNGLSFAKNGFFDKKEGCGDYCSLPTDILYRIYRDETPESSLSEMSYNQFNCADYGVDYEQMEKLEDIKYAGGFHPEVEKFFEEMDYEEAEKTIVETMEHYGFDEESIEDTISRLQDIQGLFMF